MSGQEALDEIMLASVMVLSDKCKFEKAVGVALNALRKQIPKNTIVKVNEKDIRTSKVIFKAGTKVHFCPTCRTPATGADHYCRNCGQALIW